ncbi:hypothetical protein EXW59_04135 (plasmid) [Bacillus mycoides]|uniref:helix-turn-helix domain-containing protein n=1 Tax=Bacillus mycoides TaxID=1405 RepID=UPI001C02C161|nr:helix-turn-helix domain-containing protein [Bacillus mycoides]QWH75994.1 hypothetical protein EXW59_04135 [Bacillus mycoides]
MRVVAKKVQMIRLQEEQNMLEGKTKMNDSEQCKIETDCIKLDTKIVGKKSKKTRTTEEKWDKRCKQAVHLFRQGLEYPDIAKEVGCNVSHLYRELKKRGVLQIPKQVAPCKSVKLPIITPQTKKAKFERYKEYYMYR